MDRKRTLGYIVDVYVPKKNMIIEVDGPSHYYGSSMVLNAKSKFKRNHLKALGFAVISLSHRDINKHKRDGDLEAWVCKKLSKYPDSV